jgi:phenylpyruvate tautomerase
VPYLAIQTNKEFDPTSGQRLMKLASQTVSELLGKPESYVMVALVPPIPMIFAGNDEPLAYLELKSIGLPEKATATLSNALCALIHDNLGIAKERIYIEFADAKRTQWGWNGGTF